MRFLLLALLTVCLIAPAMSSPDFKFGKPVEAKIKTVKPVAEGMASALTVELLEKVTLPTRYPEVGKGDVVELDAPNSRTFKAGQRIRIRWRSWRSLGANGAEHGLSWEYVGPGRS